MKKTTFEENWSEKFANVRNMIAGTANAKESFPDRWKDIEAGKRAGCKTFFIDYDYKEKKPTNYTYRVKSLNEAVEIIMGQVA